MNDVLVIWAGELADEVGGGSWGLLTASSDIGDGEANSPSLIR